MYGLTIKGFKKRVGRTHGLAAVALAALAFISAMPAPRIARARPRADRGLRRAGHQPASTVPRPSFQERLNSL